MLIYIQTVICLSYLLSGRNGLSLIFADDSYLMQAQRIYFQYIYIIPYIISVHTFHSDINDDCDSSFHLRPPMTFFAEPDCRYQNQDIPIIPLPAGIKRFLDHITLKYFS